MLILTSTCCNISEVIRPIYISGFDYAGYTLQFQLRRFFSLTICSFNALFSGLNLP